MLSSIQEGIDKLKRFQKESPQIHTFKGCRALVLCDIHIPYHEPEPLSLAIEAGVAAGCDVVILNGDIIDCFEISKFSKETGRPTVYEEIEACKEFLQLLREYFPDAQIVYKLGNHEERLRHFLLANAKELADLPCLEMENLLGFGDLGISKVGREKIMLGKLAVLHGHELPQGLMPPVNIARGVSLRTKSSVIVGHWHQSSKHSEGDIHNNRTACWSSGCLCGLSPDYSPYAFTKWVHGFAIVDVEDDGTFTVHNHEIIDGKVH